MKSYTKTSLEKLKIDTEMKYKLIIMDNWWSSKSKHYHISGSFNVDLYIRIMKMRAK